MGVQGHSVALRRSGVAAGYVLRVHSFSVAKAGIFAACESSQERDQWARWTRSSLSPKGIYQTPTVCAPSLLWWCLATPRNLTSWTLIAHLAHAGCLGSAPQSPSSRSFKCVGWRNPGGPPRYCQGDCGAVAQLLIARQASPVTWDSHCPLPSARQHNHASSVEFTRLS